MKKNRRGDDIFAAATASAYAQEFDYRCQCALPQAVVISIQRELQIVMQMNNGGTFKPGRMWSAVVDWAGVLCSVTRAGDAWPRSRAIAKASTANDFSNSALSLSTASAKVRVRF